VFLPIGDEPNVHPRPPWVNYGLVASNVAIFLWAQALGRSTPGGYEAVVERWGYVPTAPTLETLFSSMFMHAGWMHLFGNMLFLWIFGDNVESRLGGIGYLAAYLATGAAATLAFGAFNADSASPLVGASGAISGVQGLYFLFFAKNRVKLLIWFYYVTVIHVPARWIIGFWFVLNDLVPVLFGRLLLGDQVAHAAHLGGFATGLALAATLAPALRGWFPEPPRGPYGSREPSSSRASPAWGRGAFGGSSSRAPAGTAERIVAEWRTGRRDDGADLFAAALRREEALDLPEAEHIRLAVHLYDGGRFEDARRAFRSFLDAYPQSRNAPAAAFGLGMILSRRDGDAAGARPLLEVAVAKHPDPDVRELARREVARLDAFDG